MIAASEYLIPRDPAEEREAIKRQWLGMRDALDTERAGIVVRVEGAERELAALQAAAENAEGSGARAVALARVAQCEHDLAKLRNRITAIDESIAKHRKARP